MSDKLKRAIFTALVCALGAQANEVFVLEPGETLQARSIGSVPGAVKVRMFNATGHALVLTRSGDAWVHGENAFGQLGLGHAERVDGWHRVQGLSGVRAIAAGAAHSVALLEDGTVWTWGAGHQGQLGHRALLNESKPRQVQELKHAVAVAAGGFFTAVRTADGSTWVFGSNWDGVATAHAEKILDAPVRLEAGGPKTEAHRLLELAEKEPWGEVEWGGGLLRSRAAGFTVTRDDATLFSRQAGLLDLFADHTVAWVEAAEPLNAMKSGSGSSKLARASL